MLPIDATTLIQPNELVLLVGKSHKNFIVRMKPGAQFQSHRGVLNHDDLIGRPWGSQVFSHKGNPFYLLQPTLGDLIMVTKRSTQIMYPKDIGFILVTLGIGPGMTVVEAGTGSGAMTTALAFAVGPQGRVISYEAREDMQRLAQKNLIHLAMDERVTFKLRDIGAGFDEQGMDVLFMDVANPEDYVVQVRAALKSGGRFGCILPTTNQIARLIPQLVQTSFAFIEVCEILLRYYKTVAERVRPTDRMVAHTGYLVFARPITPAEQPLEASAADNPLAINEIEAGADSDLADDADRLT